MKGKFITLEGCEGVGKSRQLKMLEDFLVRNEVKYYFTREPGGTDISEQIRKIILDEKNVKMTDECEAMLYASARIQLVKEEILPRVEKGELVICDRYIDSSFAYQGEARGLGETFVKNVNSFVMENCMPDLTLFLNLSPEQAFKRKGGVDKSDRLELSGLEFHQKVYNGYINLAKKYPERIVVIDASGEKEQTHAKIVQALRERGII